jgi:hypothetical protein
MRRRGGISVSLSGHAPVGLPIDNPPIGRTIIVLAILAGLAHVLDLVTFLQVMATNGPSVEANPVGRWLFMLAGPAGIALVKLTIAIAVPSLLVTRARAAAAAPLAQGALVAVAVIGAVGFTSNLLTVYL